MSADKQAAARAALEQRVVQNWRNSLATTLDRGFVEMHDQAVLKTLLEFLDEQLNAKEPLP